ncbi:DUF1651 domain-containing protein [Cyanobium sp. T1G-Tous]|uniref:DUF1651 domain-containing protein n=1 Tax=Cyanobium sp. T1G-Tous TaxID=2823722 RepID=UPI0020CC3D85|nr:DUF1651 domain-containing protein [Cyanobium sp. T1G-Tous]MCP9804758.1 DUF1651 domain-containing protein [Cyanobium sp. T1G-Tous]
MTRKRVKGVISLKAQKRCKFTAERIIGKQAWNQDPKTANTARFHWDPKSWYADPMYLVDSGRPLPGASRRASGDH